MKIKVAIQDFPRICIEKGWIVKEVIMGEGAETIVVVEDPKQVYDRYAIRPKAGSKLSYALADVFDLAKRAKGISQRMVLRGGMTVDVLYHIDGRLLFQISRKGMYPSDTEWKTTCNHLPFDNVAVIDEERFEHGRMCYIRGVVSFE